METKDLNSTETAGGEPATEAVEPESTATSSDTLSDIEQTEKVSDATGGQQDGGSSSNADAPSPDGQFDGGSREGSSTEDPGPM
jgi:hypothetical protein